MDRTIKLVYINFVIKREMQGKKWAGEGMDRVMSVVTDSNNFVDYDEKEFYEFVEKYGQNKNIDDLDAWPVIRILRWVVPVQI